MSMDKRHKILVDLLAALLGWNAAPESPQAMDAAVEAVKRAEARLALAGIEEQIASSGERRAAGKKRHTRSS